MQSTSVKSSHLLARRQVAEQFSNARLPKLSLDHRLRPEEFRTAFNEDPPTLHFGLVYKWENVASCARKYALKDCMGHPINTDHSRNYYFVADAVSQYLGKVCDRIITCQSVIGQGSFPCDLISIYNNKNQRILHLSEEIDQETIRIIRGELNLGNQEPKWWWDEHNGVRYSCPLIEYNPPCCPYPPSKSVALESAFRSFNPQQSDDDDESNDGDDDDDNDDNVYKGYLITDDEYDSDQSAEELSSNTTSKH